MWEESVLASNRRTEEQMKENGKVVVVEEAAPKSGTELTRERLSENLRSLNSDWTKENDESYTNS